MTGGLIVETNSTLFGSAASATLSPDGVYRYALTRTWRRGAPAVFVMLNPSTADAMADDPTIRRCIGFATRWGCGGVVVVNLFGLRSTDPAVLYHHPDPIGPDNDAVIAEQLANHDGPVVAAWGMNGVIADRDEAVTSLIRGMGRELQCLGVTKLGLPRHPLYVAGATELSPWWFRSGIDN
jgi:hypothetical protein